MAHESFESDAIAAQMNADFVNIKVDREERPDLDAIYQAALQMFGEQGGWPLTMFLTPDAEPYWGGTYFPSEQRYGRPGFPQVLEAMKDAYDRQRERVTKNVEQLRDALERYAAPKPGDPPSAEQAANTGLRFLKVLDPIEGGINGAPKFPQPGIFRYLWAAADKTGNLMLREAVHLALRKMCQGGIYDHLGGGFARYSTDESWLAPHFEKMLYDNAQLVDLMSMVWRFSRDPLLQQRVEETIGWMLREMRHDNGCFASAYDADSEGEEGKFYVWSEAEIDALLGDDAAVFKKVYDVSALGNWEGKTILNRRFSPNLLDDETEATLARCRSILFEARRHRIWPSFDDKVLADWNGLAIHALVVAGETFGRCEWIAAGATAFDTLRDLLEPDGRLKHAWRAGRAGQPATLEDYAALMDAATALYRATGDAGYLAHIDRWKAEIDARHADTVHGGYFTAADDTTDVIVRFRGADDNATPSGNGLLALTAARLWHLTGDPRWESLTRDQLRAFGGKIAENPFMTPVFLEAAIALEETVDIVLVGPGPDDAMVRAAQTAPAAHTQMFHVKQDLPAGHPAHGKAPVDGAPLTAYVCRHQTCGLPVTDADALTVLLRPDAPGHSGSGT